MLENAHNYLGFVFKKMKKNIHESRTPATNKINYKVFSKHMIRNEIELILHHLCVSAE